MIEDINSGAIYKNAIEWRFEFPEVLDKKTKDFIGFDIVIGNPPYGVKIGTQVKDLLKKQFGDVHMRTPDTYIYFISQAFRLLAKKSLANLIVPNNLFYQNENEKARQLLLNKHLISACNLGDNVFVDANVPTCVYIVENQNVKKYKFNYADYRDWNGDPSKLFSSDRIKKTDSSKVYSLPAKVFGVDTETITILEKVRGKSVTINEIAKKMACGISTGGDKIFRIPIDFAKQNQFDLSLLKKVLIGREVHKYSYHHNNHFIIYTTRQTDISRYNNIQTYLFQYKENLSTRSECKSGILPWFALNRHRSQLLFEGKKVIIRQTADHIIATYDEEDFYLLDSLLVLKLKNDSRYNYKFILAVLNSSFSNFLYMNFTQEGGRVFAQVKPKNIRKLPIPQISPREQNPFIELVDKILAVKKKDPKANTSELETEIDEMIYNLYDLTPEEIAIIEEK
ncbi:MAG: Eco57I restriction-modification methylase domain-containing protein [Sedimentisphaerales bacterium]|nr:Eco57I restriction-modification methylase domain-containing protein [Sedimentisphaerales bacterium]